MIKTVAQPREATLAGDMHVLRILPFCGGKMVGPFAFLDRMGPMDLKVGGGGDVPPHPHAWVALPLEVEECEPSFQHVPENAEVRIDDQTFALP
jgi:redox-sensitive bicupin YhaK (pirin superfamily)